MIPVLPRDIYVPPSVLRRRFAICSTRPVVRACRLLERRGGISVDRSDNGLFIRMIDPGAPPPRTRRLSQTDWLLLETLDTRRQRPLHTGRFLTMHKRRRKRLMTRSLSAEFALLDDIHHGQVTCVLDRVHQWPFNAFTLDIVTGGRSLPVLCVHLFHWYGLLQHFHLDVVTCWKLFSLIEEGYHSSNPYHNSIHATDVTQAMHCFLQEHKIREHLTPLEIMAALIAAVTHDLDHPGVNQPFLIATSNHLAALYENTSVLENHHWRSAIGCLLESHVAEQIEDCRPELQRQISSLILATDITRQQEFLVRFKRYLDQDLVDMTRPEDRHFILQIALKCADISNPCRPWEVSKRWSQKVCEEFFRQGDYERQLKLPVTALCDRLTTSVPKIQIGFLKFVVYPLFEEWHRFLGPGLSEELMRNLKGNQEQWEALAKQEAAEETKTEISEAELLDDEISLSTSPIHELSEETEAKCLGNDTRYLAIPDVTGGRVGRRHSVPLSIPAAPAVPRTIIRRESLAIGEQRTVRLLSAGCLDEGEEELLNLGRSSLSLLSSSSAQDERPVSAENLLPEPSIASITTVTEASRLSSVFHSSPSPPRSMLTRQQTFPPLQPCVRQRHMSTCSEVLRESNRAFKFDKREKASPEPPAGKIAKLDESVRVRLGQKENVVPGGEAEILLLTRGHSFRRPSIQTSMQRRRGSAPAVGLLSRDEPGSLALRGCRDRTSRRGSVPLDIALQSFGVDTDVENNVCLSDSYPVASEVTEDGGSSFGGGKTARNRGGKKVLRRRSSGGPEMFRGLENNGNDAVRWRRSVPEPETDALRRRGSLPVDVLLATQRSGDHRALSQSRPTSPPPASAVEKD